MCVAIVDIGLASASLQQSNPRRRVRYGELGSLSVRSFKPITRSPLGMREAKSLANAMEVPTGMRAEVRVPQKLHLWHSVHFPVREGL